MLLPLPTLPNRAFHEYTIHPRQATVYHSRCMHNGMHRSLVALPQPRASHTCAASSGNWYWFDEDPDTLPPRHVDVAIVGGGPGGLATANALLRVDPSLHIEVFERLPHRPMGSSILLNVNGQNAIEAIDPQIYYHLLERSVVLTRTSIFNATTGDLVEEHPDRQGEMLNKYGKAPRLLGWHEIRETLLEALPPDMVHFNQPVLSYQDLQATHVGGGIRVEFIEDIAPVEAKILIGADGWFSYTRFQNLHDPPPSFQNRVFWRARIPWRQGLPNDHTQWFVEGDRATSRFACIIPVSDTEVVWQASAPATDVKAAGLEVEVQAPPNPSAQANASFHADPKRRCLKVFGDFCRAFSDVVDLTDPVHVTEQPLYGRDAVALRGANAWGRGRVTLVGDAAHPSPPNGQGCNLAFEDALELAHAIQNQGLTEAALRSYEAARVPRVLDVLQYGTDFASAEDRERVIYAPKFEPLRPRVRSGARAW